MGEIKQSIAAKEFANYWKDRGYEKGDSQPFWLSLLQKVYGVPEPEKYIKFENQVFLDHTSFIDGMIQKTKVLIEQKSIGKDLKSPIKQSDGSYLTPFEQAKRYVLNLPHSNHPRWIITCNFQEFHVYDMEHPEKKEPEIVLLKNLAKEYRRLQFLVDEYDDSIEKQEDVSFKAGELVGELYDEFLKQYINPKDPSSLKSLNKLCVRLVFCLYAEDSGVFPKKNQFHDYLIQYEAKEARHALIDLFKVLDQKLEDRDPYLNPVLADFPYVNGGLFADEDIEIPNLSDSILDILLSKASRDFDWSSISPTIFGALFESTLNQETRRNQGMHYTSIENIHKVIDPLFLDSLKEELARIKAVSNESSRNKQFDMFREKLSSLCFLDPACGSGNFLTETYLSLRRMENEILKLQQKKGQILFDVDGVIKVSIDQFYGIEYNDFAVTVAKTALWIAESQMMKETELIVAADLDFLPLKTNANIVEGNALRIDWDSVVPKEKLSYIMGNPPFLGYSLQNKEQKEDMLMVCVDEKGKPYHGAGKIDYVSGWYYKSAEYINGTNISVAFVSTNSITQGEQVTNIWKPLFERYNISIIFGYRTFKWGNEAKTNAAVHCVIIGFNQGGEKHILKFIIGKDGEKHVVKNIHPYLLDMPDIFVEGRNKPLCASPTMYAGGKPTDGGFLILSESEFEELRKLEPKSLRYIRKFSMGNEFINNIPRYCLWLVDCPPNELREMPLVMKRVKGVKEFRENSKKEATRKKASTPMLFDEIRPCEGDYIAIPKVSSESRDYVPIGFLDSNTIPGDKLFVIPGANLYHFGVLTSSVHMAWMRTVAGRLEMRYSYSNTIVYNNFPWPNSTESQRVEIGNLAQNILNIRLKYHESSLADLYDPIAMPTDLREAHKKLDNAVEGAYGKKFQNDTEIVSFLLEEYQRLVESTA